MKQRGILIVCDANICRSATAELVFAEEFAQHSILAGIAVSSRGVQALSAHSACRFVSELRSGDTWRSRAQKHRSRPLDERAIEGARLILTATTGTRSAVVSMAPSSLRKVFTLREALWLADGYAPVSGASGEAVVTAFTEHLDRNRGLRPVPAVRSLPWRRAEHPFDIADGHLGSERAHIATVQQVEAVSRQIVAILAEDPTLTFLSTTEPAVQ